MILVTGATGLNGSELVRRLSAKGIPSRALVRNPAKAQPFASLRNVEVVEGDMARPDSLTDALRGVERAMLISSSDQTMVEVQSSFIDAARRTGVQHIVKLSGILPELDSPFRFARMHAEIEKRLEASGVASPICAQASSCPRTFVRSRRSCQGRHGAADGGCQDRLRRHR
jgi:uncharacterized protein YbjT (DUF2867 family)